MKVLLPACLPVCLSACISFGQISWPKHKYIILLLLLRSLYSFGSVDSVNCHITGQERSIPNRYYVLTAFVFGGACWYSLLTEGTVNGIHSRIWSAMTHVSTLGLWIFICSLNKPLSFEWACCTGPLAYTQMHRCEHLSLCRQFFFLPTHLLHTPPDEYLHLGEEQSPGNGRLLAVAKGNVIGTCTSLLVCMWGSWGGGEGI